MSGPVLLYSKLEIKFTAKILVSKGKRKYLLRYFN